jgi:hypothetical protein
MIAEAPAVALISMVIAKAPAARRDVAALGAAADAR